MTTAECIRVGGWYRIADGRCFKIVSLDGIEETVEIQYADGDVEELELEYWYDLEPMPIAHPDHGPFDMQLQEDDTTVTSRRSLSDLFDVID